MPDLPGIAMNPRSPLTPHLFLSSIKRVRIIDVFTEINVPVAYH